MIESVSKKESGLFKNVKKEQSGLDQKWANMSYNDRARHVVYVTAVRFLKEARSNGKDPSFWSCRERAVEVAEYHDQRML